MNQVIFKLGVKLGKPRRGILFQGPLLEHEQGRVYILYEDASFCFFPQEVPYLDFM